MSKPEYAVNFPAGLPEEPSIDELRYVVAFLPEIYQDYIEFLAANEEIGHGDSGALRPCLDGQAGGE